jgi:hypothetical protein
VRSEEALGSTGGSNTENQQMSYNSNAKIAIDSIAGSRSIEQFEPRDVPKPGAAVRERR